MLYQQRTFTCPSANPKTEQINWDLAILTRDEFTTKYDITDKMYDRLLNGEPLKEIKASYRVIYRGSNK